MEKEKKIELECDYCGSPIKEEDHKCPNCGANCNDKIKKYKKQQEKLEEEKKAKDAEYSKQVAEDLGKAVTMPVKIIMFVAIFAFAFIFVFAMVGMSLSHNKNNPSSNTEEKVKDVSAGCNELAETDDFSLLLDSYEFYEYRSDSFPESYNTPEGYQKIAFHFVYTNKRDDEEYLSISDMHLTSDDYKVESAGLSTGVFEKAVQGKATYPTLLGSRVGSNEKLQGYVGYLVPKNTKTLKFTMDHVTITMDNPAYEE